jgi:hypothetical protein
VLSKGEFNEAIDACCKFTAKVYSHNRHKDVEGIGKSVVIVLAFTSLLLIAYFFCLFYGIRDKNKDLRIAGYFCLGISVLLTSLVGIINCC